MKALSLPFLLLAFGTSLVADDNTLEMQKSGCRQSIIDRSIKKDVSKFLSPILGNDRAENLVDEPSKMVRSIEEMEKLKLKSGQSLIKPWSDSYWPLYKGGLGQRYSDEKFTGLNWKDAFEYVYANPAEALIADGNFQALSPSEKYDFLLNLNDLPLTKSSWEDGRGYFESYGTVESWMGLCHGWAAASMMVPEPKKKVTVDSALGKALFYPSDIKALSTLLWSKGDFNTKFIGGRCNSKNPREDSAGRPRENNCLDNNPGTWHLVVVNQLGISKRPFIMDANYDYEVWNHPVFSYEYTYINPKTGKRTKKLADAIVRRGEWEDSREKFRSRDADYVVGINMVVTYAIENYPSKNEDQMIETSQMELNYDLELNRDMNIVGGEWLETGHPDFLWVPEKGSSPRNYGSVGMQEINFSRISPELKRLAELNAAQGLPLKNVVDQLVKKSAQ